MITCEKNVLKTRRCQRHDPLRCGAITKLVNSTRLPFFTRNLININLHMEIVGSMSAYFSVMLSPEGCGGRVSLKLATFQKPEKIICESIQACENGTEAWRMENRVPS